MTSRPHLRSPSRVGQTVLPGHGLRGEGAAFVSYDCPRCPDGFESGEPSPWPFEGHALCRCGAESPHLLSGGQRKRWHSAHKDEVRSSS